MARLAPPVTQDVLITNQVRVLGCLELLEDLRANPQVTQEVLRRVREFEEEFLQKAIVWASAEGLPSEIPERPSIEQVLAELKAIGMQLPRRRDRDREAGVRARARRTRGDPRRRRAHCAR